MTLSSLTMVWNHRELQQNLPGIFLEQNQKKKVAFYFTREKNSMVVLVSIFHYCPSAYLLCLTKHQKQGAKAALLCLMCSLGWLLKAKIRFIFTILLFLSVSIILCALKASNFPANFCLSLADLHPSLPHSPEESRMVFSSIIHVLTKNHSMGLLHLFMTVLGNIFLWAAQDVYQMSGVNDVAREAVCVQHLPLILLSINVRNMTLKMKYNNALVLINCKVFFY